jgi:phosphatidylserine/phosphatidylglycerophosphate/cardiolipin synthase-like enzyme
MKLCLLTFSLFLSTSLWASIASYHNHNEYSRYTDPYRNITRSGDNLEAVIVQELSKAKSSIYIAVQELRLPLIAQVLVDKHRQGVDVRVVLEHDYNFNVLQQRQVNNDETDVTSVTSLAAMVDVNGNGRFEKKELLSRDAIYMLQYAGVPLLDDTSDDSMGSGLMHHKFVVIDGKRIIISTANFTMSCIHGDILRPKTRGNANSLIVASSTPLARIFTQEFSQLWGNGRQGNFGQNKTYRGPQTVTVGGSKITVQFSPTSRRFNWNNSVNGLIGRHVSTARKSVKAALFVFSDQNIANILQKSQKAGAKMGFIIEPGFAFRPYSELLDMLGLSMLDEVKCNYEPDNNPWSEPIAEAGQAFLIQGDMLHHKFAVVDGEKVIVGSQNWTDSANYTNDETLVIIQNKSISDSYTREYDRLKKSSYFGATRSLMEKIQHKEKVCEDQGHYF